LIICTEQLSQFEVIIEFFLCGLGKRDQAILSELGFFNVNSALIGRKKLYNGRAQRA
jgi:hypothetical protein